MPILGIMASQISGKLWQPDGAYDSLATVTVPSGGLSSIVFAGIPNTYKHLQIRGLMRNNAGTSGLEFIRARINSDSTSGNYYTHYLYGSGAFVASAATSGTTSGFNCGFSASNTNTANTFCVSVFDFLDYANTSKNKTMRSLTGADYNDSSGGLALFSGLWMNTAAISSIEISSAVGTGFVQNTTLALYGVK